jgi:ribonuclease HI
MKERELAEILWKELLQRDVPSDIVEAIPYGQKVSLEGDRGQDLGKLTCYWGKKGPKITTNELTDLAEPIRDRIDGAIDAALQKAQGSLDLSEPLTVPEGKAKKGVHIWVDGSFVKKGARSSVGWGLAVMRDGQEIHRDAGTEVEDGFEAQWNVAGEITAVLKALEWCRSEGIDEVTIHYDYEGLAKWPTGRWRAKNPHTQSYARTVRTSGIDITWNKVRAHSGEPGNELADGLARKAAEAALKA